MVLVIIVQLSVLALSTSATVMVATPLTKVTEKLLQKAAGGVSSTTVTVAGAEFELPLWSVTVSVTRFGPRSEQSNKSGTTVLETMVQLSKLLLSICAAVMLTELPIRDTVISLVIAVGGVTSEMVTVALQLDAFPL